MQHSRHYLAKDQKKNQRLFQLRPCHWHDLPFGKLLAATPDGKPVTQYPSLDEGFFHVVSAIKGALNMLPNSAGAAPVAPTGRSVAASVQSVVTAVPRSSNLRIKKEFTDRERDCARAECFEFVAKYFANSLEELGSSSFSYGGHPGC